MRALIYRGPGVLELTDRPDPPLDPYEVRVAVESAGICGTDLRILRGGHSAYAGVTNRVPGHEIVGRVVEIGRGVAATLTQGDRVFVAPNIGCGKCLWCRRGMENLCPDTQALGVTMDGGLAERVIVPARAVERGNLIAVEGAPASDPLVLIEPLACVMRAQEAVSVGSGDRVFVAGAGPTGLLHVALARSRGAELIIVSDRSGMRRAAASRLGAAVTIDWSTTNPEEAVAEQTSGIGVDVVITAAPSPEAQQAAVRMAAPRGRVVLFGGLPRERATVALDTNAVHYKELLVTGTTASTLADCKNAAALLSTALGDLSWMITHRFALSDAEEAFTRAQDRSALKIVLNPARDKWSS
jgi:L-iditol 2-dehydrogenase